MIGVRYKENLRRWALAAGLLVAIGWIPSLNSTAQDAGRGALSPSSTARVDPPNEAEDLPLARKAERDTKPIPREIDAVAEPEVPAMGPPVAARAGKLFQGRVVDSRQVGVQGARVTPWRTRGLGRALDSESTVTSDANGDFEVLIDPFGAPNFVVEHDDFLPWSGELALEPLATIVMEVPVQLRGRVIDAHGSAAVGSEIAYETPGLRSARRRISVDATGRFEIDGLPQASMPIWITGPHGSAGPLEVTPSESQDLVVQLAPTRQVLVQVEDERGEPVDGARVVLMPTDTDRALQALRTQADGLARFANALAEPLRVKVEHSGHRFALENLGHGDQSLRLRPVPSGAVRLISVAEESLLAVLTPPAHLAEASVRVWVKPGQALRCGPLTPGSWSVNWCLQSEPGADFATLAKRVDQASEIFVAAGEEMEFTLVAPVTSTLKGRIDRAVEGLCAVELVDARTRAIVARSEVDAERSFQFAGLAMGSYQISLCASGGGRWQDPRVFTPLAGEILALTFAPTSSPYVISARSVDGAPLPGASATLRDDSGVVSAKWGFNSRCAEATHALLPAAIADDFGRIQLDFLSPDEPTLLVSAPGFATVEVEFDRGSLHVDALLSRR